MTSHRQCHIPSKTFLKCYSTRPSTNSYTTAQSSNDTRRVHTLRPHPVCKRCKSTASLFLSSSRLESRAEHSGKALLPQVFTGHLLLPHMHANGGAMTPGGQEDRRLEPQRQGEDNVQARVCPWDPPSVHEQQSCHGQNPRTGAELAQPSATSTSSPAASPCTRGALSGHDTQLPHSEKVPHVHKD